MSGLLSERLLPSGANLCPMPVSVRTMRDNWRVWFPPICCSALGVWMVWTFLNLGASYWNSSAWVATDNIAYFGWGALAGIFGPLFALAAIMSAHQALRPRGHPLPAFRLRDRPLLVFLIGLAVGVMLYSISLLDALVASGTRVPWLIIWGIGFGTLIVGWVPVLYAAYQGFFQADIPGTPSEA